MTTPFKSKHSLTFSLDEARKALAKYKKEGNYLMEVKTQEKINNLEEEIERYDRATARTETDPVG